MECCAAALSPLILLSKGGTAHSMAQVRTGACRLPRSLAKEEPTAPCIALAYEDER